jgi:hypothetical protein
MNWMEEVLRHAVSYVKELEIQFPGLVMWD